MRATDLTALGLIHARDVANRHAHEAGQGSLRRPAYGLNTAGIPDRGCRPLWFWGANSSTGNVDPVMDPSMCRRMKD